MFIYDIFNQMFQKKIIVKSTMLYILIENCIFITLTILFRLLYRYYDKFIALKSLWLEGKCYCLNLLLEIKTLNSFVVPC